MKSYQTITSFVNHADIPFCYPGQIELLDKYNYTYDGNPDLQLITGYPALCINDTFVPVCDTAGVGLLEARIGCVVSTNFTCEYSNENLAVIFEFHVSCIHSC